MAFECVRLAYLLFPLVGGALFQGICLRLGWLEPLRRPIDFGVRFGGRRLLGDNKTFRGVVGSGIGSAFIVFVQSKMLHSDRTFACLEYFDYSAINPWLFGFLLGVCAMLSELPNSFAKRQLGIAPGAPAPGLQFGPFYVLDQVDVLAGVWLFLSTVMEISAKRVLASIALVFVAHQLLNVAGYLLGMRKTLR